MFLNIFNEISNAFNKPSKYADGGNLGGKKYYLTGYSAMASEDSYEEGELKQVSDWEVRDSKVFNTKEQLVEYINKHIIYKDYDVADFDWETGKGENIQTGVLCAYDDYNGYFPADKSEIEQWKKGKKKLYNVHYFIYVTAAIPTEYAKGGGISDRYNAFVGDEKITIVKNRKEVIGYPVYARVSGHAAQTIGVFPTKEKADAKARELNNANKMAEGGGVKHFVGKFTESQLKKGEDKIAIEKAQKETGLKYIESKIIKKNGKPYLMEVYLTNMFSEGGGVGETKYAKYKIRKDILRNGESVPVGDGYVSSGIYEGRYRDEDTFEIKHNGVWKVAESIDWEIAEDKYANGGGVNDYTKNFGLVKVKFENPTYNYETSVNGDITEAEARKYFVGKMFDVGIYPKENMQKAIDIEFYPKGTYANGGGVAKGWTDAEKSDMEAQFGEGGKMRWWSVTLKMPNGEIANEYVVAGNRNDAIYHGGLTDSAREGGKVLSVKFQGVEEYAKGGNVRKKRLTDKYKYVPNYMVQEVEVERNGKTTAIDGSDVLDGFYVKKGIKYAKGGGIMDKFSVGSEIVGSRKMYFIYNIENGKKSNYFSSKQEAEKELRSGLHKAV